MNTQKNKVPKDTIRFMCLSCCVIICLVSAMVFSPLAYQYEQNLDGVPVDGLVRGDDEVFGATSDPETELKDVEAAIQQRQEKLPSLPYFDRFYSKERHEEFSKARAEIYEQQWERIGLLQELEGEDELVDALEEYVGIIGYHQEEAKQMLASIREKGGRQ